MYRHPEANFTNDFSIVIQTRWKIGLSVTPLLSIISLKISHMQFMFRYVNKLLPNVFESYFTLSTSVHTYNTRQQSSFRLPYYRTNLGKRSVRYTGIKIWSEVLKSEIDTNSSQPVFKHNLKRCLLQGIICLDCSKVTT